MLQQCSYQLLVVKEGFKMTRNVWSTVFLALYNNFTNLLITKSYSLIPQYTNGNQSEKDGLNKKETDELLTRNRFRTNWKLKHWKIKHKHDSHVLCMSCPSLPCMEKDQKKNNRLSGCTGVAIAIGGIFGLIFLL